MGSDKTTEEGLKRVVGISGFSLNIINFTIGAGIFALPAMVGVVLGAYAIFAYIFCGLMLASIMLCFWYVCIRVREERLTQDKILLLLELGQKQKLNCQVMQKR